MAQKVESLPLHIEDLWIEILAASFSLALPQLFLGFGD